MFRYIIFLILLLPVVGIAQTITGKVVTANNQPLPGASIIWMSNKKGVTANEDGSFSIKKTTANTKLIASHSGYATDTIDVSNSDTILFVLKSQFNISFNLS